MQEIYLAYFFIGAYILIVVRDLLSPIRAMPRIIESSDGSPLPGSEERAYSPQSKHALTASVARVPDEGSCPARFMG